MLVDRESSAWHWSCPPLDRFRITGTRAYMDGHLWVLRPTACQKDRQKQPHEAPGQAEPLGHGDAIRYSEAFAVLLGDVTTIAPVPCVKQLLEAHARLGRSLLVPPATIGTNRLTWDGCREENQPEPI